MSNFSKEELNETLIEELHNLVETIAKGEKRIVEQFKKSYGNTWESTSYDYALIDLKSQMLKSRNNLTLVKGFTNVTDELRRSRQVAVPTKKEIDQVISESKDPDSRNRTYAFVEELGAGQMGRVDKVEYTNKNFRRYFARKTCETIDDLKRFAREITILSELDHPGVVNIVDGEFSEENAWYVMELIQGNRLCRYRGEFWERHEIICELLKAVAYLHKKGVVHRDLKPENIMVRESDGRPVIVDFGSSYSKLYATMTTTKVGQTMGYFGPEVMADPDSSRSPQNDIFACGVIAYELLTGTRPNPVDYSPLAIEGEEAAVLEKLDRVILKAIAYRVENRFESVEEMLKAWRLIYRAESSNNAPTKIGDHWKTKIATIIKLSNFPDHCSLDFEIPEKFIASLVLKETNKRTDDVFSDCHLIFTRRQSDDQYYFDGALLWYRENTSSYLHSSSNEVMSLLNMRLTNFLSRQKVEFFNEINATYSTIYIERGPTLIELQSLDKDDWQFFKINPDDCVTISSYLQKEEIPF